MTDNLAFLILATGAALLYLIHAAIYHAGWSKGYQKAMEAQTP